MSRKLLKVFIIHAYDRPNLPLQQTLCILTNQVVFEVLLFCLLMPFDMK